MRTRAIFLPDARDHTMLVFELKDRYFVCVTDDEIRYEVDVVMSDSDWVILSIDDDVITNVRF